MIPSISASQLHERLSTNENIQLIDVRHESEQIEGSLGGLLIPLPELYAHLHQIDFKRFTVIYCRSGVRSLHAVSELKDLFEEGMCVNLTGGIKAYFALPNIGAP